jgi:hypothetical protein
MQPISLLQGKYTAVCAELNASLTFCLSLQAGETYTVVMGHSLESNGIKAY